MAFRVSPQAQAAYATCTRINTTTSYPPSAVLIRCVTALWHDTHASTQQLTAAPPAHSPIPCQHHAETLKLLDDDSISQACAGNGGRVVCQLRGGVRRDQGERGGRVGARGADEAADVAHRVCRVEARDLRMHACMQCLTPKLVVPEALKPLSGRS